MRQHRRALGADAVFGLAVAWDLALIATSKPFQSSVLTEKLFGILLSSTATRWMLLPTALSALFWATGDTLKLHISAGVVAFATIVGIARRIVRFASP